MADFILHHYPFSPYSEKVRSMLAYANVDWVSVISKEMPPRPHMKTLAGGYARIPVAQIGADIFCDSNVIASEIAALGNKPELDLANVSDEVRAFVQEVEGIIFFACVLAGGSAQLRKKVMKSMSLWDVARFFIDRINMGRTATVKAPGLGASQKIVREHLARMEEKLTDDFLFGKQPNIGDFAAYHSLWFVRDLGEKAYMNKYPKVMAWMDRIKAFTKTAALEMSTQEAIRVAKENQPRMITNAKKGANPLLEEKVAIAPSDYRLVFTPGILKAEEANRWIIERANPEIGKVHVHFPKSAYTLKKIQ